MEEGRNDGESSCNFGDGTDQNVQSLMFKMMMMMNYSQVLKQHALCRKVNLFFRFFINNVFYIHFDLTKSGSYDSYIKGKVKSVPLHARGAQRVPGS